MKGAGNMRLPKTRTRGRRKGRKEESRGGINTEKKITKGVQKEREARTSTKRRREEVESEGRPKKRERDGTRRVQNRFPQQSGRGGEGWRKGS